MVAPPSRTNAGVMAVASSGRPPCVAPTPHLDVRCDCTEGRPFRMRAASCRCCSDACDHHRMEPLQRREAIRAGVRLELVTVAWLLVDALLAIVADVAPRSVLLTAFSVDNV